MFYFIVHNQFLFLQEVYYSPLLSFLTLIWSNGLTVVRLLPIQSIGNQPFAADNPAALDNPHIIDTDIYLRGCEMAATNASNKQGRGQFPLEELMAKLGTSANGLSQSEAQKHLS